MAKGNGTLLRQCKFLNEACFDELYSAFSEAFSDYVVPFALTKQQFRNHINLTGVDLNRTVGCLLDGKLVGFSLNGFGVWDGRSTAYDAGTGVIPSERRRGISEEMFRLMLAEFQRAGVEQVLLEVITSNIGAIGLYKKLGFRSNRLLALLQRDDPEVITTPSLSHDIREMEDLDWTLLSTFWDAKPAWQNSVDAIDRSSKLKRVFGAFASGKCVGYIIFSGNFGRIAQLAVARDHRRQGIATALLREVQNQTAPGFSLQVINIDIRLENAMLFFEKLGFYQRLTQHEMIMELQAIGLDHGE